EPDVVDLDHPSDCGIESEQIAPRLLSDHADLRMIAFVTRIEKPSLCEIDRRSGRVAPREADDASFRPTRRRHDLVRLYLDDLQHGLEAGTSVAGFFRT